MKKKEERGEEENIGRAGLCKNSGPSGFQHLGGLVMRKKHKGASALLQAHLFLTVHTGLWHTKTAHMKMAYQT